MVVAILATTEWAGLGLVKNWLKQFTLLAPRLAGAIIIMVLGWQAAKIVRHVLPRAGAVARLKGAQWVVRVSAWLVLLVSLLVALEQLGAGVEIAGSIVTSLLMVIAGSLALTLALGSREIVADILGAYQLKKVYKPGQKIRFEDKEGVIQQITASEMILETEDGELRIPGAAGAHLPRLRLYQDKK